MKKLLHNIHLLLVTITAIILIQTGCKKETTYSTGTPVITHIRNYVASPGDSLLSKVGTGQWVVISGQNLKGALHIYFDGTLASFNDAWFSDTSAIALIPSVIAFPSVPSTQLNTIRYVTTHGETTFAFPIVAPAPSILSISNESANAGDSVKINGLNFFFIKSVVYAGKTITSYTGSSDGTTISLAVPAGITTGGPVTVITNSGSAATVFNVEDFVNGVFCNFDNVNSFQYYSASQTNDATLYPGGRGNYARMNFANIGANSFAWYDSGRSINMNEGQWVPQANLSDAPGKWAVKFEIYVKEPWKTGAFLIRTDSYTYMARYEPWKTAVGNSFTTKGWVTVTLPLSQFKNKPSTAGALDGTGDPTTNLTTLLGTTGKKMMSIMFYNDSATPVTKFDAAVDNIRIVKIL